MMDRRQGKDPPINRIQLIKMKIVGRKETEVERTMESSITTRRKETKRRNESLISPHLRKE